MLLLSGLDLRDECVLRVHWVLVDPCVLGVAPIPAQDAWEVGLGIKGSMGASNGGRFRREPFHVRVMSQRQAGQQGRQGRQVRQGRQAGTQEGIWLVTQEGIGRYS